MSVNTRDVIFKPSLPLLLALASCWYMTAVQAQDRVIPGRFEYLESCAACHGPEGKGDGPVAPFLTSPPGDLTQLSKRNDGRFPFLEVFQFIDGRNMINSHGTREMPIWGYRYKTDIAEQSPHVERLQGMGSTVTEQLIRGRILELVNYLQTIQEGSDEEPLLSQTAN